jgi:acetyltransferase-like isoleucine patch superfamily enzyme
VSAGEGLAGKFVTRVVTVLVARLKHDPSYRLETPYTPMQLAIVLWHRGRQYLRGLPLRVRAGRTAGPVFRGRRVVVEHARQLRAGRALSMEDGAHINALSRDGVVLGDNVTIARNAMLVCTGVIAQMGVGITVGDRSAVGAGSLLGGQGGIAIGRDVIMGPGVRIFSENHRHELLTAPIRAQGVSRRGVRIGDDCWIGAGATIVDGVTIGAGCVVAAGAVVTRDLPPQVAAAGVPARMIR